MESKRMRIHEWDRDLAEALPCAEMYEKSYMHRDTVTHVAVATRTNFFVTASSDGHLKLWKKVFGDVEFVKHFRAHLTRINDLCVSFDGTLCATVAEDKTLKVYDIVGYDLMVFIPLQFSPQCSEWIYRPTDAHTNIAIADRESGKIFIFDVRGDGVEPLHTLNLHRSPVRCMKFVEKLNLVISGDESGMIEYWSTTTYKFPEKSVNFDLKLQTDLFVLAKQRLPVEKLAVSPDGKSFAVISNDRKIRIFRLKFGKLKRTYDETLEMANQVQKSDDLAQKLEDIDFGRRLMIEKQMDKEAIVSTNVEFDESGEFLVYATHLGIKIVHIKSNKVVKVLGKIENTERFLRVALYQGSPNAASGARIDIDQPEGIQRDPVVLCCAYKKQRLYMFTRREPDDTGDESLGRDVFNERPSAEEMIAATPTEHGNKAKEVVLHTTSGDIAVSLYGKECPKTVENFTGHCRNGYYDNVLFHRVIKGFMIQTGDPLGDGTGGTSIWGKEFEDEFHGSLRHNRPYIVSMANSGPNTNGSQFFITTAATPWLDNKHTVFGIVTRGTEVVNQIECVETDDDDKPLDDIKILNVSVLA